MHEHEHGSSLNLTAKSAKHSEKCNVDDVSRTILPTERKRATEYGTHSDLAMQSRHVRTLCDVVIDAQAFNLVQLGLNLP